MNKIEPWHRLRHLKERKNERIKLNPDIDVKIWKKEKKKERKKERKKE